MQQYHNIFILGAFWLIFFKWNAIHKNILFTKLGMLLGQIRDITTVTSKFSIFFNRV